MFDILISKIYRKIEFTLEFRLATLYIIKELIRKRLNLKLILMNDEKVVQTIHDLLEQKNSHYVQEGTRNLKRIEFNRGFNLGRKSIIINKLIDL